MNLHFVWDLLLPRLATAALDEYGNILLTLNVLKLTALEFRDSGFAKLLSLSCTGKSKHKNANVIMMVRRKSDGCKVFFLEKYRYLFESFVQNLCFFSVNFAKLCS